MIKLTKEEVIERYNKKGLKVLNINQFKKITTKLTSIDKDGYMYYFPLAQLKSFNYNIKSKVARKNPYSLKNVNTFFKLNHIEEEALGIEWRKIKEGRSGCYIKLRCKCGNYYYLGWSNILNQRSRFLCKRCSSSVPNSKKYDFDFVKDTLKKYGYTLLDNYYKGNNDKMLCINKDGYKVYVKFANIAHTDKNPYIFSKAFNLDNYIYNVNNYFKINDIDCKALRYDLNIDKYSEDSLPLICQCSCGNEFYTCLSAIKQGQVYCTKCTEYYSRLSRKVEKWLKSKHIEYIREYTFDDCKDIKCLPFDFYLPKYNYCIEVDGSHHEKPVKFGDMTTEEAVRRFKITQKHDKIKDNYCENNNIKLIRIPQNKIERKHEEYKQILYENLIKK